jgi:hypothetical protein
MMAASFSAPSIAAGYKLANSDASGVSDDGRPRATLDEGCFGPAPVTFGQTGLSGFYVQFLENSSPTVWSYHSASSPLGGQPRPNL